MTKERRQSFQTGKLVRRWGDVRAALDDNDDWVVDLHQRFDFADAVRACRLIEVYEPYFVEDPVADAQALMEIPKLRQLLSRRTSEA